jgi:hypothetical protein
MKNIDVNSTADNNVVAKDFKEVVIIGECATVAIKKQFVFEEAKKYSNSKLIVICR